MNGIAGYLLLAACLGVAACNKPVAPAAPAAAARPDGWLHYAGGGNTTCDSAPLSLDGSHVRVVLAGPCRVIRVTGEHNDVILGMAPGGSIDVTGAHNDIWWHAIGRGRPPELRDGGTSNSFHREDR